ncbi:protein of unknown function [Cyanobium sp. NIES-981]|nr:protein of unknown function [Cyanobium sp. NIES-981]
MTLKDRAGVPEVPFGVGLGGGEARKRFVEQGGDSLLFGERGDAYNFIVNKVAIERWNTRAGRESTQVKVLEQVKNESLVITMEVFDIEHCI